jgi:hypothetical protein
VRHRSIGDLMRYAALNQDFDFLSSYRGVRPIGDLPPPSSQLRYGDDQLYALARYLYALKPPPNPNRPTVLSRRGRRVFEHEGCVACHTPPLYTNNKLTPALGFEARPAPDLADDVLPISVETNPALALTTRRGTGYYKVPSLRRLWYRGPLSHDGSVLSLRDWFDLRRLRDDYVPTGYRGFGVTQRAVPGHRFGLDLSERDCKALVAFLNTL